MSQKNGEFKREFVKYIRRTAKNKMVALTLIAIGLIVRAMTGEATVLVLTLMFGIPLFLARNNYIQTKD